MNNQLIEKIIKTNNEECPEFTFKNPVLDRNVARALSSSFVKILRLSDENYSISNNLRQSVLENIRKLCKVEPTDHVSMDDSDVECLRELYQKHIIESSSAKHSTDKQLDAFLLRRFKVLNIDPTYEATVNPEIIQALINLNKSGVYLDVLSKDIIHWHVRNGNYMNILRDLWKDELPGEFGRKVSDDIAIKMKPEIEKTLLSTCYVILTQRDTDIESLFADNSDVLQLTKKCSSPLCFQICSGILNFVFVMTNFDSRIQTFVSTFVKHVKNNEAISVLYPLNLKHLVALLDFDLNVLPEPLKKQYILPTINYLRKLHDESENDLILLLSHYPQWFDIYFAH